MPEDTISAISTAVGEGAVGIVRVSGPAVMAVAEKIFRAACGKPLAACGRRQMVYGYVHDPEDGSLVDEVLAVYMPGPHSYTAEDVVEIQCHGGVQALQKILALTYQAGARPAEAGEFTKRAFLNGRLDLTQAEAVMNIIRSRSEAALKLALRQEQGQLARALRTLRLQLRDLIVTLEAKIDYPEEDLPEITLAQAERQLQDVQGQIDDLLAHAHTGKIIQEGLRTAIVGRPNTGKSSLLNALVQEECAIVSAYPGTTRDVIKEQLLLNGIPLLLADTAGIRQAKDFVEQLGVQKSKQLLQDADLALCVLDGSEPLQAEDEEILQAISGKPCVIIVNKQDLPQAVDVAALQERFGAENVLALSAKTSAGMQRLTEWLQKYVYGAQGSLAEGVYVQNARHELLLQRTAQALRAARQAAESELPYDCIIIDLRQALEFLGSITGDTVQDEVINEIFARFCIGK